MHNNIKNIVLLSIIFFFLSCSLAFGWVSNRIPVKDRTDDPTFATGRSYYYSKSNVPYFIDGAGEAEQLGGGATAFTLPTVDGNNLEVLVTDGAGVLSWGVQSGGGGGGSGGATGYGSDEAGIQIPTGISEFWIVGAGGIKTKVTQSPTTGVTYYLYPAGTTVYGTDGSLVSGASNIWIVNDPTGTSVTVVSDGTGGATVYVGVASGVSVFDSYGGSFINQRTVHISGHTGFVVEVQGTSGLSLFPIEALPVTAKVNEAAGIDDGNVVYINGATGPFPQVGLADKDDPDGSHIIGIATETKTNGQSILIGLVGLVSGVSTSAYTAGDHMYLQNNGDWSNVPPTVGNVVHFGVVVYSHAINGKVLLRMHHVHVHSMALGETEVYRIPAGSKYSWVEEADSSNTPFEVSPSGVSATNINVSGGITIEGGGGVTHFGGQKAVTWTLTNIDATEDVTLRLGTDSTPHTTAGARYAIIQCDGLEHSLLLGWNYEGGDPVIGLRIDVNANADTITGVTIGSSNPNMAQGEYYKAYEVEIGGVSYFRVDTTGATVVGNLDVMGEVSAYGVNVSGGVTTNHLYSGSSTYLGGIVNAPFVTAYVTSRIANMSKASIGIAFFNAESGNSVFVVAPYDFTLSGVSLIGFMDATAGACVYMSGAVGVIPNSAEGDQALISVSGTGTSVYNESGATSVSAGKILRFDLTKIATAGASIWTIQLHGIKD